MSQSNLSLAGLCVFCGLLTAWVVSEVVLSGVSDFAFSDGWVVGDSLTWALSEVKLMLLLFPHP